MKRLLAAALAALLLAGTAGAGAVEGSAAYLRSRQAPDGGFAEPGGRPTAALTAWAALGLRSAGAPTGTAADYLAAHEDELASATDVALSALAQAALGRTPRALLDRLERLLRADGAIGPSVNSTIWSILALRQAGQPVPKETVAYLLRAQSARGGFSWAAGVGPDSNDTAAAIQALRAAGAPATPVRRALAFLRGLQNADGGFALTRGRPSDAQSTAWAIQAFAAAGRPVPATASRYLARLRRPDGSYRYSARYAVTPVWVTAQVLPALLRKPFPLR